MARTWTDDHGPDELYPKFEVRRKRTGELLGEDGEFLMVLRPETDAAAWTALFNYATAVAPRAPNLARQIREKLDVILDAQVKCHRSTEGCDGDHSGGVNGPCNGRDAPYHPDME